MSTPFDYINTINKKVGIFPRDNIDEFNSIYNQYVVNLAYCRYPDTIMIANDMALMGNISNEQHFDYLYEVIPKSNNRWAKWHKVAPELNIEVIQEVYKYSYEKAKSIVGLFTEDQIDELKTKIFKGGT